MKFLFALVLAIIAAASSPVSAQTPLAMQMNRTLNPSPVCANRTITTTGCQQIGAMSSQGYFTGIFGSASIATPSWVTAYFGQTATPGNCCSVFAVSPIGQNTAVFASRSSDDTTVGPFAATTIAESCLAISDNSSSNKRVWCRYAESHAIASAMQYQLFGDENDVENFWSSTNADPFNINPTGSTVNLRLGSGYGTSGGGRTNVTTAFDIINNGTKFNTGIMFDKDALNTSTASGTAPAIAMAPSYAIDWYSAAATIGASIYWDGTNGARIFMGAPSAGLASPGAGSVGQRIQLYGTAGTVGASDYGIGVESGAVWFSSGSQFKWYGSTGALRMTLTASGYLVPTGGVTTPELYVSQVTPASAAAACTVDRIVEDTGFIYVCTATNTWKRVAIATW